MEETLTVTEATRLINEMYAGEAWTPVNRQSIQRLCRQEQVPSTSDAFGYYHIAKSDLQLVGETLARTRRPRRT